MTPAVSKNSYAPIRLVGDGEMHHFFGYYNKTNWDRTGRYLLANRVPAMDAPLTLDLAATVGYFDVEDADAFHAIAETTAWNWQMGCQLQWLDGIAGRHAIYNVRTDDESGLFYPGFASEICNIETGEKRRLPLPVYVVAPNSRFALCVDYSRLFFTHPTIGYTQETAGESFQNYPSDDGIHLLDLETGEHRLIVSYRDLRDFRHSESMDEAIHWVSHIEVNPSSSRVVFLHRWTERVEDETCFLHRLIAMNPDGSDIRLLEDSDHPLPQLRGDFDPTAVGKFDYEKSEYQISHPLWRDDDHIVVWSPHEGSIHYHLYEDKVNGDVQVIGKDILTENGHMSFSPTNPRWLLSDTYPDAETNERALFLFDVTTEERVDLGVFYTDPGLSKENRCDLHPRWRRDGQQVCIDSVHEDQRQMYIVDVGSIVNRP